MLSRFSSFDGISPTLAQDILAILRGYSGTAVATVWAGMRWWKIWRGANNVVLAFSGSLQADNRDRVFAMLGAARRRLLRPEGSSSMTRPTGSGRPRQAGRSVSLPMNARSRPCSGRSKNIGPGSPRDSVEHLGVAFASRRDVGTGLGIAVAHDAVARHAAVTPGNQGSGGDRVTIAVTDVTSRSRDRVWVLAWGVPWSARRRRQGRAGWVAPPPFMLVCP